MGMKVKKLNNEEEEDEGISCGRGERFRKGP